MSNIQEILKGASTIDLPEMSGVNLPESDLNLIIPGNLTNPRIMYPRFIEQKTAAKGILVEPKNVMEEAKEVAGGFKDVSSVEDAKETSFVPNGVLQGQGGREGKTRS